MFNRKKRLEFIVEQLEKDKKILEHKIKNFTDTINTYIWREMLKDRKLDYFTGSIQWENFRFDINDPLHSSKLIKWLSDNERVRDEMSNALRHLQEENRRLKEEINQGIWGKM